ncbi:AP2-like ethylene-responsive transcription factor AIL7 [Linum perenne]
MVGFLVSGGNAGWLRLEFTLILHFGCAPAVYLGGYDKEDKAARAYDLAALKYWGPTATTNFPVSNYNKELEEMKYASKQEFIASLRRKSSGFSRGASIYRGVTRHHQQGRWQARIGRVAGNKDLYLGTFATEEEAAEAYDIAAIKFRGMNAVTNFEMNRYDVEAIMKSALPIGGAAKRLKISLDAEQKPTPTHNHQQQQEQQNSISFGSVQHQQQHQPIQSIPCGIPFDATALYHHSLYHHQHQTGNPPPPNTADSTTSNMVQTTDFFLWPHHQSY